MVIFCCLLRPLPWRLAIAPTMTLNEGPGGHGFGDGRVHWSIVNPLMRGLPFLLPEPRAGSIVVQLPTHVVIASQSPDSRCCELFLEDFGVCWTFCVKDGGL